MLESLGLGTAGLQVTKDSSPATRSVDRSNPVLVTAEAPAETTPAKGPDTIEGGGLTQWAKPTTASGGLPATKEPKPNVSPDAEAKLTAFLTSTKGAQTNQLMNEVATIKATKDAPIDRPVTTSTTASKSAGRVPKSSDLPRGALSKNADGSITTPGGYKVINDGGYQWRIQSPDGKEHRIWGDPHVDENNDGTNDWHFNADASFILPDGTKIFCDTDKVSEYGGEDVTLSVELNVQYQSSLATMDVRNGGETKLTQGGAAYDATHGDGEVFVLGNDNTFIDGATMGDLYDAGGDFKADVDTSKLGTVSDNAMIALYSSLGKALPGDKDGPVKRSGSFGGGALSDLVASVYAETGASANLSQEDNAGPGPTRSTRQGKETAKPTAPPLSVLTGPLSALGKGDADAHIVNATSGSGS